MVKVMPNRGPELGLESNPDLPEAASEPVMASVDHDSSANSHAEHNIPRWRKIEIMKERAALREALGDDELDLEALEIEVFGTDEENESLYRHGIDEEEDEEDFDDDDFEDDDFEAFDED